MYTPTTPWTGPSDRERSRQAAQAYALLTGARECRRARRQAVRAWRLRRLRRRTARWLLATAHRLDPA